MKKSMPTILSFIIGCTLIAGTGWYCFHFGVGKSLSAFGFILLAAAILLFLFFLSIDPGYGWTRSDNFNKNYIVIFITLAIFIIGVALIFIGQHLSKEQVTSLGSVPKYVKNISGKLQERSVMGDESVLAQTFVLPHTAVLATRCMS